LDIADLKPALTRLLLGYEYIVTWKSA